MAILLVSVLKRKISKMSKIDISNWHKFKIDNLFEKITTKKLPYKATQLPHHATEDNLIPLVTAGVEHQGRSVYAPKTKDITVLSNCLTISANGANSGATFYQDKPFSILQDAYAIQVKSSINENVSKYEYCFLASVIGERLQQNDWTNKATWNVVKAKEIRLPVTESDEPDWQYMDEYIAKLATQAHTNISLLRQQQKKAPTVNIDRWKELKLSELFDVDLSDGDNKPKQLESGDIPLVVASGDNNGIIGKFTSDTRVYPEGTITLDMFGHAFLQNHKFQAVSHGRVNMLLPKMDVSLNSLLFIVGVLNKKCSEGAYGYAKMLSQSEANAIVIKLPVISSGQPNWHYMDEYIAKLATQAHTNINLLRQQQKKAPTVNIGVARKTYGKRNVQQ